MRDENRNSPFTPGSPVPVELFVGRATQIKEVIRCLNHVSTGRQENVFLSGDRGIGKSSLSSFLSRYASNKNDFIAIHVFLGGVTTLSDMIQRIFDKLLKNTSDKPWFGKIASLFGKFIKEVGLFGISVGFSPPEKDLKELVGNFPEALHHLIKAIEPNRKGLFIALDDINGLAEMPAFANWYKSFVDYVATHYDNFPVFMMLIGLPEKRDSLSNLQPSLMRIFRVIDIEKLTDSEVKGFFEKAFNEVDISVEKEALHVLLQYSSGLPVLMHEIGDATFLIDEDGIIDERDAFSGIVAAADRIGKKYLDPQVYRALRSNRYRSILRKLADQPLTREFKKSKVEERLNDPEKKVFHNFLTRMRKLGIIESDIEKARGNYRFVNEIYPVYIWMESQSASH